MDSVGGKVIHFPPTLFITPGACFFCVGEGEAPLLSVLSSAEGVCVVFVGIGGLSPKKDVTP